MEEQVRLAGLREIYYQGVQRENQQIRTLRHDLRNHVMAVSGLLERGETEQALGYLEQLTQSSALSGGGRLCDNEVANVVLTAKAKEVGVKKAVVTHASQAPWKLSMDQAKAVSTTARIWNTAYCRTSRASCGDSGVPGTAAGHDGGIRLVHRPRPGSQFISTDLGQALNPNPVDGMRTFITGLRKAGVKDDVLNAVTRKTPAMLLGLD